VLPPWVKVLPYALGVLAFVFVSIQLFRPKVDPSDAMVADNFDAEVEFVGGLLTDPETRDQIEAEISGTAPAVPPPNAEGSFESEDLSGTVVLQLDSGGPVEVPASALAVARTATMSLFTGAFGGVPLADGVVLPDLARTWSDPYVGDPVVVSLGDGTISFAFRVDPDRDGPEPTYKTAAMVLFVPARGWVWAGV